MAEGTVGLPADGTGTKLRTQTGLANMPAGVAAEVMAIQDDTGQVVGSSSHPVRVDPTGSTAQPVSGTVTANPPALPTSPLYGQTKVSVTNTAVPLPSHALTNGAGFIAQALSGNSTSVWVGDSSVTSSNGFELQPGQATSVALANTNDLYVNGTSGDGVCFIGS